MTSGIVTPTGVTAERTVQQITAVPEIRPLDPDRRAVAHTGATAIFGGFTPAISTYLIHATGNRAIPGLWLSFAAACGLIATILLRSPRVARHSLRKRAP